MTTIAERRFAALTNLASNLKTFLRIAGQQPEVEPFSRAMANEPAVLSEVAASSVSFDLHTKLNVYQRNEVEEYVVWRVLDREIDWFVLRDRQYERLPLDAQGLLRSVIFPGLWLDPAALVRGELAAVLAVVQQGLASPEPFVARLKPRGAQTD